MAKNAQQYEQRPWGSFEVLIELQNPVTNTDTIIKQIIVAPGKRLSYQTHKHRSEHWYVTAGEGVAIINEVAHPLRIGDSVDINPEDRHRIDNTQSSTELVVIEIITGQFDEYDIERIEDDFKRSSDWKNQTE